MTMQVTVKDEYIKQFEEAIKTLPKNAVDVKKSLDEEIRKRSKEYRSGKMKTTPFGTGLDRIREKLVSQL